MTHLTEEQVTLACYGEAEVSCEKHLLECAECSVRFASAKAALAAFPDYLAPRRDAGYGGDVWMRLQSYLPPAAERRRWFPRSWMLAAAMASLLIFTFFAGMLIEQRRHRSVTLQAAREQMLALAVREHFEKSQILLTELLNADPSSLNWKQEGADARDLLASNRLLRQANTRSGDDTRALVLEELERILLEIANGSTDDVPGRLKNLRDEVYSENLLFKLRVLNNNSGQKGRVV